ncbi:MAG: MmcQ/YjbR family DNA-binding protein [Acidobacteriota bacterium]|nr:MmcQ/YjbR family DNA-binding protein [Acidobacteriota bacterium]
MPDSKQMNHEQIERVRRICLSLPEATETLSHGEPTWFVRKKVFAMFSNNHHNDGHIAVTLPVPLGVQAGSNQDVTGEVLQASLRWRARLGWYRTGSDQR